MLKDRDLAGLIAIYRTEVRPYTEKQIDVVKNFAAQAVIAIENARLLSELRESLQQQTATADVLKVISSSPGDLQSVFDAMLDNATRICEANFGNLMLYDGEAFRRAAYKNAPQAYVDLVGDRPVRPGPHTGLAQLARTKRIVHIEDVTVGRAYEEHDPLRMATTELLGARTFLAVPMLKDETLVGAIIIYRKEVRLFTGKQIELVKNFAAQAVIAIENTRLLNELRQRTDDLSEALEQQTATSEVLGVISGSPGDLKPVFQAMLENATRICNAKFANLLLFDGRVFRMAAMHGASAEWADFRTRNPEVPPTGKNPLGRVLQTKKFLHIVDTLKDPGYLEREPSFVPMVEIAGARTVLSMPMIKENELVGVFNIYNQEVRAFTPKQIELVQNFAAQAVIAIENTRLLNELRESLEQQTATSEVLNVISRSTFQLQPILDSIVATASRLCQAEYALAFRLRDGKYHVVAANNAEAEFVKYAAEHPIPPGRASLVGRTVLERKVVHIPDCLADPEYKYLDYQRLGKHRSMLGVPLLRDGVPIGVIDLLRNEVKPFTEKQIELVSTFADQAVIAIENVRLFDEIQDKSRQLAEASQHKSQFLASMSHELRTPLNAILGYTELIADGIYGAVPEKMQAVLKRVESNGRHLLGLINAVLDLSKIEAGQLTLDLADYSLESVAQTVYNAVEPLALDKKLAFRADIDADLPAGRGDERRLTQVLLNLVGNAIKFTDAGEVVIKAGARNGDFHVSVRDTGPGISDADQARLFREFQQADNPKTRRKEGTGLGLAISKRIVEMHGGRIWIESQLGRGSTFFVTLPVRVLQQVPEQVEVSAVAAQ